MDDIVAELRQQARINKAHRYADISELLERAAKEIEDSRAVQEMANEGG